MRNDFTEFARGVSRWIGHNFLTFDATAIKKILGVNIPNDDIVDTLILSRLMYTGLVHQHGLGAWGERIGLAKGDFHDFSKYTPEMLSYMLQDLEVTEKLFRKFEEEIKVFNPYSVKLEHRVQALLDEQRRTGFYLNINKAHEIYAELGTKIGALEVEILAEFPPVTKLVEVYAPKYLKQGGLSFASSRKLDRFQKKRTIEGGKVELYEEQPFNLGSPKQIVERMNELGWEPTEFTEKGTPKVSEVNFSTLPKDAPSGARKIGEWLMLRNRRTVLEGWFDAYNPATRRLHGTCIGIGAITHRMAHRNPQMGNVPAVRNPYGEALRSCLGVEDTENYRLLGVDLSSIQLCILAHYLDDPEYIKAVAFGDKKKGTDAHSINRDMLRKVAPNTDRDTAKTFVYAMLLGAGGSKLGSILGVGANKGSQAKNLLANGIPGFKRVTRMCQNAAQRGYMIGLDGRRTPIKSAHYALSAYLQCGEAVVIKQTLLLMHDGRFAHLDWKQLAVVHDEVQIEVHKDHAEELAKGIVFCIEAAGKFFEVRCPLTGEYYVGLSWADSH